MTSPNQPPSHLIDYLNEIAKQEGFVDYTLHFDAGSSHGEGFMASMIAATIRAKQDGRELHLICKLLPDNKDRREFFQSHLFFEREVQMYNVFLPMFHKFQKEKNIELDDGFFAYPKCFLAVSDAEKDHHVIIMENLRTIGYELWDKMQPVDFHTSSLFLSALGRYHALSFAIRDQRPDLFQKIIDLDDILLAIIKKDSIRSMMIGAFDKAIENLVREDEIKLVTDFKDNYAQWMAKVFDIEKRGPFNVLSHGDCWNNNFSFLNDENKIPSKVCLFDFQISSLSSPATDLSYYLLSSTTKDLRVRYEELLKVYHNSLCEFVTRLGSDATKLFSYDELKKQLKESGVYGVLMAPILLQIIVSDSKNISDMDTINKDTEALQLAVLDELSKVKYRQRVSDALQDAKRFGWIQM